MYFVGVAGKVSQSLYGSLEIHKQGGKEGLPAVQRLYRLKYGADEENSHKRYYIKRSLRQIPSHCFSEGNITLGKHQTPNGPHCSSAVFFNHAGKRVPCSQGRASIPHLPPPGECLSPSACTQVRTSESHRGVSLCLNTSSNLDGGRQEYICNTLAQRVLAVKQYKYLVFVLFMETSD